VSALIIRNAKLVNPGKGAVDGELGVVDGSIAFVGSRPPGGFEQAREVDAGGRLLTPGLIDIHTHGIAHYLYANGASEVGGAARELGRFGVTTVLPTIIPQMKSGTLERLAEVAAALPAQSDANMPGLHLEGPFMAVGGAACPTLPGDLQMLEDLLNACEGRVTAMSLSPDAPNVLPVIRALRERGITVLLTHTRAGPEQTEAALDAGATHATHFYDVFHVPAETDPGVRPVGAVEAILADARASVDFIADGVHVHPTAIRAALAAKGWSGIVLITDSNIGAGLPPGVYPTPWGYSVRVSPETAARHVTKNSLSGSSLTMDRGIANLFRWLRLPPEQIWAMGTLNPARVVGLEKKGRLEPGADADLVLWNENFEPAKTWVNGRLVYEKETPRV
jgi:N-acetylglucosamine-6-phosphate deacetylase